MCVSWWRGVPREMVAASVSAARIIDIINDQRIGVPLKGVCRARFLLLAR